MTTNVTTTTASSQGDVPLQPPYAPLIVNYTNDNKIAGSEGSGSNDNSESNGNDSWDRDNDDVPTNPTTAPNVEEDKSGSNQGVRRLQCKDKGVTKKYTLYSLLMAARQEKYGGPRQAFMHDKCVFIWQTI